MASKAYIGFGIAIQDSIDLMNHFDTLNSQPPPPEIEVLKRASLVMALAALETYFEDRIMEAVDAICGKRGMGEDKLINFYKSALEMDLKSFHSPNVERVKHLFKKYLDIDITEGWVWNNCTPKDAKEELNRLVKKRGDIAHRSLRPTPGQPVSHAVKKDDMRKHLYFIKEMVKATDTYLELHL
ncbi:MAG: HEPN domain-containing protein [Sulfuricurvum sp.]|nr:HEPN domain-containing protein [Sulfuricurvum sp.]